MFLKSIIKLAEPKDVLNSAHTCLKFLLNLSLKGPDTYLLEPVAKENCENSKLAMAQVIK